MRCGGVVLIAPRPTVAAGVEASVVVIGGGVEDLVIGVPVGDFFVFVELVMGVGGEGVFGLVVFVVVGEGLGGVGGGGVGEGAVAAVVEKVFDGDEGGG